MDFLNYAFFLLICLLPPTLVSSMGINYGQIADNLPSPERAVPLVKSIGASKVKLYDANPNILKAFANTGIEFIVCVHNEDLSKMNDAKEAQKWVQCNVKRYLPSTKITTISVGNEILTFNDSTLSSNLLPAMHNIHAALVTLGLDGKVSVTTAHSLGVLDTSYPPSSGVFRKDLADDIKHICEFHCKTGSPFLINAYPYFAYKSSPKEISLEFVLFEPNQGIVDPVTNLHYDNMLMAQIDAVHSALSALDSSYKRLPVQISETGWPSKGDEDEVGATPENAKKYNGNLIKFMSKKKGTPLRPDSDLTIYVFALFNEDLKPGPTSERNYGLFKPDGSPSYNLGISSVQAVGNSSSTGVGGGGGGGGSRGSGGSGGDGVSSELPSSEGTGGDVGYMSISFAPERRRTFSGLLVSFYTAVLVVLLLIRN